MGVNLQVIGAGMGRTGTTSLKIALERLLNGPCFHFIEYRSHPELMDPWRALAEKLPISADSSRFPELPLSEWEKLFSNYVACVDEPGCYYWKPLSKSFPEALFILSTRDTDSWWASMRAIDRHRDEERKRPDLISAERRKFLDFETALYGDRTDGRSRTSEKAFFETHNRRILEHAESDENFKRRLLVWNVKDGWEPICRALDLPVPDIPFPHLNKRADYHGY